MQQTSNPARRPALALATLLLSGCALTSHGDWLRDATITAVLSHQPLPEGLDADCLHGVDPATIDVVVLRYTSRRYHHSMALAADARWHLQAGDHVALNPVQCRIDVQAGQAGPRAARPAPVEGLVPKPRAASAGSAGTD